MMHATNGTLTGCLLHRNFKSWCIQSIQNAKSNVSRVHAFLQRETLDYYITVVHQHFIFRFVSQYFTICRLPCSFSNTFAALVEIKMLPH